MWRKRIPIVLCAAVFSFAVVVGVCRAGGPIRITSDRLDAYDDKALVLFSGNVEATQDEAIIHADELYLYYDKDAKDNQSTSDAMISGGSIKKIELSGNVTLKKGERTVTGDKAVFHNADQTVVMTGHAVMREGDNVITGDKITVFLKENRGFVESSGEKKRVTAVIYPKNEISPNDESDKSTPDEAD